MVKLGHKLKRSRRKWLNMWMKNRKEKRFYVKECKRLKEENRECKEKIKKLQS